MQQPRTSRNLINLLVDGAIFCAFLVAMAPRFSGIAIHEWLGIAFGAAIVAHLLLHWSWIVAVIRRLFGALGRATRVNALLNILLFIDMIVTILSGVMISREALPVLGISLPAGFAWREIHGVSANAGVLLTGLHLALHWQWIVSTSKRLIMRRPESRRAAAPAVPAEEL